MFMNEEKWYSHYIIISITHLNFCLWPSYSFLPQSSYIPGLSWYSPQLILNTFNLISLQYLIVKCTLTITYARHVTKSEGESGGDRAYYLTANMRCINPCKMTSSNDNLHVVCSYYQLFTTSTKEAFVSEF